MWYDTKFGRVVTQFAPGSIVVSETPRVRVRVIRVDVLVDNAGQNVIYTSVQGVVHQESNLWKTVEALQRRKRIDYLRGQRELKTGFEVYPLRRSSGSTFVEKTVKVERIELSHFPMPEEGRIFGVKTLYHCSNGRRYYENAIFETYVEAVREATRHNSGELR